MKFAVGQKVVCADKDHFYYGCICTVLKIFEFGGHLFYTVQLDGSACQWPIVENKISTF